ncbi:uncharacterized protein LOC142320590 [Lycorma delicatula]|uniref:uncharacterized protein LOC142320590 n=1 Tax=Lycorma delicatula TaxID=130591 RepID=UPI003F510EFB
MSRKRKVNFKEFEYRNGKDLEERRDYFAELKDDCSIKHRKEGVSSIDDFSSSETLISESIYNATSNKDDINIVDDLNVSNDLLFINPESSNCEYILSENDILNLVTENVNFCNESDSLCSYGNDTEILFGHSFEYSGCNNLDSIITNVPQNSARCDTLTGVSNNGTAFVAENLENIVPNLCASANSETNVNSSFENESVQVQYEHSSKNEIVSNNTKEPEKEIYSNKSYQNPFNNFTSAENNMLNEFLQFKESQIVNDSINNEKTAVDNKHHTLINNLVNVCGNNSKEKLKIFPLRYFKSNIVLPQILSKQSLPSATVNKIVPLQKCLNLKNLNPVKLNVKKSQLLNNEIKKIQSARDVPLIRYEDYIKLQNKRKLTQILKKPAILRLDKADKSVQTISKCIFYSNILDKNKNKSDVLINNNDTIKKCDIECTLPPPLDRIKKPEPFNKLLLFTFAVNIRTSLSSVLTQEDFVNNNEKISYYTGIPQYSYFMALLNCLNLPHNNTISPFQMLLLTLMKIRLNLDWTDLAYRFGRSVQVAKDTFGITVFILKKCLSHLVGWPMQDFNIDNYSPRTRRNLYVYSIKINNRFKGNENINKRIFICLSTLKHPIHFVSEPISEEYNNRLDLLEISGIVNGLVQKDVIIFDRNLDFMVPGENQCTVLSVLSKSRDSFCNRPYDNSIENDVNKMKRTVSEINKYKFLFENIDCEWVHAACNEYNLFTDVVKVVCGLVNLCDILPFSNCMIKKIISERKNIKIMVT